MRIVEYFEDLADDRGVRIESRGEGTVFADPLLLRRALGNLLANAVRYAEPGTAISMTAEARADGVALHVENRGPTIPPHHLERLFDRFYRADASRQRSSESSGLGLSIVRSIMQLHGGSGLAQSDAGVTRFTLLFPRQAHAVEAAPDDANGGGGTGTQTAQHTQSPVR
jgi:two-component system heavy metal sensor histidine kinase CusS